MLEQAFRRLDVDVVSLPAAWGARRSIDALAALIEGRVHDGPPLP